MIERIEIQNWKAFDEKEVNFTSGLNLLLGRNASGKTTILDAIALALSGEDREAATFKFLIRDKSSPSVVRLVLNVRGRKASIKRSFSADRVGGAWFSENGTEKKVTWDEATSRLEEVLGAHREFFRRIAYISEGATFRYLGDPPSSALTRQIESLFGIDVLQQYLSDLRKFRSEIRTEGSGIEQAWTEIELPGDLSTRLKAVTDELAKLDRDTRDALTGLQAMTRQLADLERTKEIQKRATGLLDYAISTLKSEHRDSPRQSVLIEDLANQLVQIYLSAIGQITHDLDDAKKQANTESARLAYLDDLEKVALESRKALMTRPTGQKCPVCKRPLDESHVTTILAEIKEERTKLKASYAKSTETISALQKKLNEHEKRRSEAESARSELQAYARQLKVSTLGEIKDALEGLDQRLSEVRNKLAELEKRNEALGKRSRALSEQKAKLEAIKRQSEQMAAARARLVQVRASEFVSEILTNTISDAVDEQQKTNVSVIQDTLSRLWGKFKGSQERVEFLPDGEMFLLRNEHRLSFHQLSGGEKTALLVLSHAIAARALSNLDFLLVDEPLEHLDLENRRSLLNFLVQSVSRKFVPQMIVSTFEESLTRKYLEEPLVHAVYL